MDVQNWVSGEYLNAEDVKRAGNVVEVSGEAKVETKNFEGEEREVLEIPVIMADQSEKVYSANRTSAKALTTAWGSETKAWVGKTIKFNIVKMRVRGQARDVLYAEPNDLKVKQV